jgi:hypothetical protein
LLFIDDINTIWRTYKMKGTTNALSAGKTKSALQVQVSYNNETLSGVATQIAAVGMSNTYLTKDNGLATFTNLDAQQYSLTCEKDGYLTNSQPNVVVSNPFEFKDVQLSPVTLTFTVTDSIDNPIKDAEVTVGTYSATTNNEGVAVISGIIDGTYQYTVSKEMFETMYGTVVISRINVGEPVVMLTAPINCYAVDAVTMDDAVKVNAGMGSADVDYNVYAANTSVTNVLTLDGVARSTTSAGDIAQIRVTNFNEQEITVTTEEDGCDIQFNNGNELCSVNVVANMEETHNYLAFKRSDDDQIIYFKDRVYPFVPSDNTYDEVSFTFYTYENDNMVSHTATTQSSSVGDSTYDGITLIIYSVTLLCNGTWTRSIVADVNNVETEFDGATITTSSYLTTPEAIIPTTNNSKFAMEKSNDWNVLTVVGGALTELNNLQEILVPNNTIIDTYVTLNDGQPAKLMKNTYFKRYTITSDYTLRKQKVVLNINVPAKVTFTVNNINKVIENTQSAQFDVYAGETVYYTIEVDGYVSQTGNYTVPQIVIQKEYQQSITLQGLTVGSRLMNMASFVTYFTPSGEYDVDSLKFLKLATNDIDNITTLRINKTKWLAQIETTLGILTPKGSSNTFTFTYNGTTWDLSGATTVSEISTSDLDTLYGITFIGTPKTNDNIVVTETQYNKFAVYVLDSNYRGNYSWKNYPFSNIMPVRYDEPQNCVESATYFNDYIKNNTDIGSYPIFNYCKNLGNFILPNGIVINSVLPNSIELLSIWTNRVFLDSCDPIIQGGATNYNLTNWAFRDSRCWSCIEKDDTQSWQVNSSGYFSTQNFKDSEYGCCPVLEVPIM